MTVIRYYDLQVLADSLKFSKRMGSPLTAKESIFLDHHNTYSSLMSRTFDLEMADEMLDDCQAAMDRSNYAGDGDQKEAGRLFALAVITYMRAVDDKSGSRIAVSSLLGSLDSATSQYHQEVKTHRNKAFAHYEDIKTRDVQWYQYRTYLRRETIYDPVTKTPSDTIYVSFSSDIIELDMGLLDRFRKLIKALRLSAKTLVDNQIQDLFKALSELDQNLILSTEKKDPDPDEAQTFVYIEENGEIKKITTAEWRAK